MNFFVCGFYFFFCTLGLILIYINELLKKNVIFFSCSGCRSRDKNTSEGFDSKKNHVGIIITNIILKYVLTKSKFIAKLVTNNKDNINYFTNLTNELICFIDLEQFMVLL